MTTSDDQRSTGLGWLVDLALYAPLGLAITVRDDLPRYVQTGKQTVAARVQVARWIGEMAVTQGRREIERRWGSGRGAPATPTPTPTAAEPTEPPDVEATSGMPDDGAQELAEEFTEVAEAGESIDVELDTAPVLDAAPVLDTAPVLDAADLPIEGYESLPALNIVQRLAGLTRSELEDVGRFEAANRKRRTILAKVEQLRAS